MACCSFCCLISSGVIGFSWQIFLRLAFVCAFLWSFSSNHLILELLERGKEKRKKKQQKEKHEKNQSQTLKEKGCNMRIASRVCALFCLSQVYGVLSIIRLSFEDSFVNPSCYLHQIVFKAPYKTYFIQKILFELLLCVSHAHVTAPHHRIVVLFLVLGGQNHNQRVWKTISEPPMLSKTAFMVWHTRSLWQKGAYGFWGEGLWFGGGGGLANVCLLGGGVCLSGVGLGWLWRGWGWVALSFQGQSWGLSMCLLKGRCGGWCLETQRNRTLLMRNQ